MKIFAVFLFLFFLSAQAFAFSIDSYETHATVLPNGDLAVYEKMTFTLDQEYNEGFRSIRKEDFNMLSDITVSDARVNGAPIAHVVQMNGRNAEIIWKKTYVGQNIVELNYTIKNRVQIYNDFAKICYEHYGANWPAAARRFESRMTLPEASRGRDMHFQVYSAKMGDAHVEDLTIAISMDNVPSGNYVGGCYLFDRNSVSTTNTVDASAYAILQNEREIYGSVEVLAPEKPLEYEYCCVPLFLILLVISVMEFVKSNKKPKYPENILPPEKEEPAVVAALLKNTFPEKDLLGATLLDLINRNIIDIVELEKAGEESAEMKRERTILLLKKRPELRPHEQAVIDMIFSEKDEVDLDKLAEEFKKVKSQADAKKLAIAKSMDAFHDETKKILENKKLWDTAQAKENSLGIWAFLVMVAAILFLSFLGFLVDSVEYYVRYGEMITLGILVFTLFGIIACLAYLVYNKTRPSAPKEFEDKFARWNAFERAIAASRIKEYPPASAVIWGDILVYATAIGMAAKVISHLSELKAFEVEKIYKLEKVRESSVVFYLAATRVHNLSKYGNVNGPVTRGGHGGFSSHSSGGWSGGGGGFSGGSSGGGGFR